MLHLPIILAFLVLKLPCLNRNSTQRPGHSPAPFCPCHQSRGDTGHFASVCFDVDCYRRIPVVGQTGPKMAEGKPEIQRWGVHVLGANRSRGQGAAARLFYTSSQEWPCTHPPRHLTSRSVMSFSYLGNGIAAGFKRMSCKCGQSRLIRAPASLYHLSNKADGRGQQTCR